VTALNIFEVLLFSSDSPRFGEFLKCFEIIFEVGINDILNDYVALLPMVNVARTTEYEDSYLHGAYSHKVQIPYTRINLTERHQLASLLYHSHICMRFLTKFRCFDQNFDF